jgi:hypothetical protein
MLKDCISSFYYSKITRRLYNLRSAIGTAIRSRKARQFYFNNYPQQELDYGEYDSYNNSQYWPIPPIDEVGINKAIAEEALIEDLAEVDSRIEPDINKRSAISAIRQDTS